jgi:Protein of unknown function (DUF2786)
MESKGSVMMDRNALLNKIRALLSKTTENGCTEAEEFAALDRAKAMMDAYAVTDEDLALSKQEAAVIHNEPKEATDSHKIKWQLVVAIEQFCSVKIWRKNKNHHDGDGGLAFCGLKSDVEFAEWLMDHLTDFVHAALFEHLICLAPKSERRLIIRGFVMGACERISERMAALCKRTEAARTANGQELVVIKSGAIDAKIKELGLKFRSCSGGTANFSDAAHAAGSNAGNRASFGRPVSGAAGVLRLGRQ